MFRAFACPVTPRGTVTIHRAEYERLVVSDCVLQSIIEVKTYAPKDIDPKFLLAQIEDCIASQVHIEGTLLDSYSEKCKCGCPKSQHRHITGGVVTDNPECSNCLDCHEFTKR
jgi:predicted SprT family Zn-dependent metalloprotease